MEIYSVRKKFIESLIEGDYYDSSRIMYERKIDVFVEFLKFKLHINESNFIPVLSGMKKETILESIKYYVVSYDINFRITVDNYVTVVKKFYEFLDDKYRIYNETFDSTKKYNILKADIEKLSKELKLNLTKQKSPITDVIYKKLAQHCDDKFHDYNIDDVDIDELKAESGWNVPFKSYVSALMTKIVMLTGVKNHVVSELKMLDYDAQLNRINIKGYWIHLPSKLGIQMREYKSFRDRFGREYKELFLNRKGKPYGTKYGDMFICLNDIVGNNVVESVAKYTIINLIKANTNIYVIKDFTRFKTDTIDHCIELASESMDITTKRRHIQSKLIDMEQMELL